MAGNDKELLESISRGLSHSIPGECPSDETIAALIDDQLDRSNKKKTLDHISSCSVCLEVYKTAFSLRETSSRATLRRITSWSIAASVLIALISFVVFFRVNTVKRPDESDLIREPFLKPAIVPGKSLEDREKDSGSQAEKGETGNEIRARAFRPPVEKKSAAKEKTEVTGQVRGGHAPASAPSQIGRKKGPGVAQNIQGPPQVFNEPAALEIKNSTSKRQEESPEDEAVDEKGAAPDRQDGKVGLVRKLALSDKKAEERRMDPNCFRKYGETYTRNPRFLTALPLLKTPPGILVSSLAAVPVRPEPIEKEEIFSVEVITDVNGSVSQACLLAGSEDYVHAVLEALGSWRFRLPAPGPVRFRLRLILHTNGTLEAVNHIETGKSGETSDQYPGS